MHLKCPKCKVGLKPDALVVNKELRELVEEHLRNVTGGGHKRITPTPQPSIPPQSTSSSPTATANQAIARAIEVTKQSNGDAIKSEYRVYFLI